MVPVRLSPAALRRVAREAGASEREIHPVLAVLADRHPEANDGAARLSPAERELVVRHATSAAMLVLASTEDDGRTRTLRIGLAPDGATLDEQSSGAPGEAPRMTIESAQIADLPERLAATLPVGPLSAPPRLTQDDPDAELRLDAAAAQQLAELLRSGVDAETAATQLDGLDPCLVDALTAEGPRASVSVTLRPDPAGPPMSPVTFSRVWTVGARGLYRVDADAPPGGAIMPVAPGDVLGTALPLLEQALQFALGRTPQEAMSR